MSAALEIRGRTGLRSLSSGRVGGYCAVFNRPSQDLGGFVEIIRPGAFSASLGESRNIRALYHHDARSLLGTTQAKTLTLKEDASGLSFELDLPDTVIGRDVAVLVDRGDLTGCSFGFRIGENGERWDCRQGRTVRELLDVELIEITLTADPAYLDTSVAKRSFEAVSTGWQIRLSERWLETL